MPPKSTPSSSLSSTPTPNQTGTSNTTASESSRRPPIPSSTGPIRRTSGSNGGKKVIIPYVIEGMNISPSSIMPSSSSTNIAGPSTTNPTPSTSTSTSTSTAPPLPPAPTPLLKSCLECSRLKIRCSRTIPCTSCLRRGVEQICPNGKMASGKGRRLILADSRDLHERIGMLERALRRSHEDKMRAERGLSVLSGASGAGGVAGSPTGVVASTGNAQTQTLDSMEDPFDPHPALLDSYLYTPKDPPSRLPLTSSSPASPSSPASASASASTSNSTTATASKRTKSQRGGPIGIVGGRDQTPIRDVRDVLMEEAEAEAGTEMDMDASDAVGEDEDDLDSGPGGGAGKGGDGHVDMDDLDMGRNESGNRTTGPTRTSSRTRTQRRTSGGRTGVTAVNGVPQSGGGGGGGKKIKIESYTFSEGGESSSSSRKKVGAGGRGRGGMKKGQGRGRGRLDDDTVDAITGNVDEDGDGDGDGDDGDMDGITATGGRDGKRPHQLSQTTINDPDLSNTAQNPSRRSYNQSHQNQNQSNSDQVQNQQQQQRGEQAEISLGTLTIGAQGEAVYIGSAGGSSFLHESGPSPPLTSPRTYGFRIQQRPFAGRHNPNVSGPMTNPIFPPSIGGYPPELNTANGHLSTSMTGQEDPYTSLIGDFPLAGSSSLTLHELWQMIPAWEEDSGGESVMENGNLMVQAYWENCDWMYNTLPRPIFDADYLPAVYDSQTVPSPHKLACVYLVMALGVMFDLERREPFDPQGGELFRLGVACLTVNGALSRPTVATVQALNLMGNFMLNDKSPHGAQAFWPFLGVAANCVTALGLHRDGTNFGGLSPYEIEERRKVFWEMTTLDRLQAMCFARPCALSNRSIDSKFPGEDVWDESMRLPDPDGYNGAKYRLVQIMDHVIEEQTRTTKGTYQDVLAIDKMIVDFRKSLPEMMLPDKKASALELLPDIHPHVMMHRFSIRLLVCECKIYLHRLYFNKALSESPLDPSAPGCTFGGSFVAVFESAVELISIVRQCVVYHPALTSRWWFFWFHAFSAAVCLAAVCIKAPSSAFASPAYISLVMSCDIAGAAAEGTKAKGGLPVLLRLRQRASNAMLSIGQQRLSNADGKKKSSAAEAGSDRQRGEAGASSRATDTLGASGGAAAETSPDRSTSSPDDDLSHLSNRPQLRRVNPSLTSPVVSTPTLMTDEGIGSTTSNTRSAGSGNGSISGSGGSETRSAGMAGPTPMTPVQTSPVSPGDARSFLDSQGALPFRVHGLNGAATFGPTFEATGQQTGATRNAPAYALSAAASAGTGGSLGNRPLSDGQGMEGSSAGYLPNVISGYEPPMAWSSDHSAETPGMVPWNRSNADATYSGGGQSHNPMNWMFADAGMDPSGPHESRPALDQPVLSLHDIDAYGMLLAPDGMLGATSTRDEGAGGAFAFGGTMGGGMPVYQNTGGDGGQGDAWHSAPGTHLPPSGFGQANGTGDSFGTASNIPVVEALNDSFRNTFNTDHGNAHWTAAQSDRNGMGGQNSSGGQALTGEGMLPPQMWHGEMTLPTMDPPGTREDLDRFMAQMYDGRTGYNGQL